MSNSDYLIEQNSWLEMIKKGHWVANLQRAVGKNSIPFEFQSELINYSSKAKEKRTTFITYSCACNSCSERASNNKYFCTVSFFVKK